MPRSAIPQPSPYPAQYPAPYPAQYPAQYPALRLKIVLPPLLLLFGLLVGLGLLLSHWLQQVTTHIARSHAEAAARSLAAAVDLSFRLSFRLTQKGAEQRDQPERLDQLLDSTLTGDPLLAYVQVRTPASTYTSLRADAEGQALRLALQEIVESQKDIRFSARRTVAGVSVVIARQGLVDQGSVVFGDLFVAVSLEREAAEARQGLLTLLFIGAGAVVLYAVVLLFLLSGVTRRMERLARGVRRVEEGDLRTRVGTAAEDELGEVGRAFDVTTERLGQLIGHVRQVGQSLERTARDVAEAAGTVRRGAATQTHDTEDAAQSAKDFVQALSSSVPQIESLRDELRLLHTIAQRLAAVSVESTPSLEEVERVVAATGDGLRQLVTSIGEVARSAGAMNETTTVTASAMADVKHSINRVRETAISAAGLAEQAGVDAERGTLVLGDSMAAIEHIREASRAIGQVTDDLQRRVGEIGDVLHLITELTQRTNLLALNASIIAAQAGAEGRGFAVVADEIKDLARRTAHSAGSIDSLLLAVAEGAHAARRAALVGGEAVESGATRARDAARTMTEILSRLRNWATMAKSIATATEEQTRSAAMVMRSIQEVQGLAGEIAAKTGEQSRRGEYLHRHASRVQDVMESLGTAGQEQREGTAQVADSLGRLMRAAEDLAGTQRNRVAEGERVRGMVEIVRRIALGYRDAVAVLDRTVSELRAQATALGEERTGPRRTVEQLAEQRELRREPALEPAREPMRDTAPEEDEEP